VSAYFCNPPMDHSLDYVYLGPRLTLGLMGLDELHLRVLSASSESPVERSNAKKGLWILSLQQILGLVTRPLFSPETSHEGPSLGSGSTLLFILAAVIHV